jgi:vacuolar-type H+-ATPase subunit I/STV1
MAIFRKKNNDPISERLKQLNAEIANIDARIKELKEFKSKPTSLSQTKQTNTLEEHLTIIDEKPEIKPKEEVQLTPEHFNEFGVKKFDLLGKLTKQTQPQDLDEKKILTRKLIASSLQGPPTLRRERRIKRNRLILYTIIIALFLYGFIALLLK